ncbi:hypothetical protein ACVGVM_29170 (plasmid) [Pseudonocardia bannensis]|uniref:Uncharacterized protein n=1 Tax=Pseudonocardia bannensis TaxID=630973 RepID=A0A848DLC1_9PSEU|nr:hypothetical protein [Pseudonocardia bannensis]NMH93512.1 hypothetical protein [Pseudonocardia bannensis]
MDRVGLESVIGLGFPARDARLEARLRDGAEAAGHTAAAETAQARAGGHERDAAHERTTPDVPDTVEREDLTGQDHARVEDNLAAGERAIAAEARGAASAAAARAEVTFTPGDTPAADNRVAPQRVPAGARPVRTRQNTASPERGRSR